MADTSDPDRPPARRGKRAFTVYMDPSVQRRLKIFAASVDSSMQELVMAPITEFMDRNNAPEPPPLPSESD